MVLLIPLLRSEALGRRLALVRAGVLSGVAACLVGRSVLTSYVGPGFADGSATVVAPQSGLPW